MNTLLLLINICDDLLYESMKNFWVILRNTGKDIYHMWVSVVSIVLTSVILFLLSELDFGGTEGDCLGDVFLIFYCFTYKQTKKKENWTSVSIGPSYKFTCLWTFYFF